MCGKRACTLIPILWYLHCNFMVNLILFMCLSKTKSIKIQMFFYGKTSRGNNMRSIISKETCFLLSILLTFPFQASLSSVDFNSSLPRKLKRSEKNFHRPSLFIPTFYICAHVFYLLLCFYGWAEHAPGQDYFFTDTLSPMPSCPLTLFQQFSHFSDRQIFHL